MTGCQTTNKMKTDLPRLIENKENGIRSNPIKRTLDAVENDAVVKSPLRSISNFLSTNASTPKKAKFECNGGSPVTPRCNIKLLTSIAAGLDYAESEKDSDILLDDSVATDQSIIDEELSTSRKGKSIAIICKRFISSFPEYPNSDENMTISLTESASNLGVEKRRIYDIVNILESVQIVRKTGKNQCIWCGKNKLVYALWTLKNIAIANGLDKIVKKAVSDCTFSLNSEKKFIPVSQVSQSRKEKSLNALTQQFLSLYITENEPLPIPLETAAHIIIGNLETSSTSFKKGTEFKTKVRRLYDIANVLVALKILKRNPKKFGKPTFVYTGPSLIGVEGIHDIENLKESENLKKQYFENLQLLPIRKIRPGDFYRTKSEDWDTLSKKPKPNSFVRHSSFQDICAVASAERARLVPPGSSFSLENSNDSCFSFLSSASSTNENSGEGSGKSQTPLLPSEETSIERSSTPKSSFLVEQNSTQASSQPKIRDEVKNETLSVDDLTTSKRHKIIKLSQAQQTTVSTALNQTFENCKVALLIIPNEENETSVEKPTNQHKESLDVNETKKIVLPRSLFVNNNSRLAETQARKILVPQASIVDITNGTVAINSATSNANTTTEASSHENSVKGNPAFLKIPTGKKSAESPGNMRVPTVVFRKLNASSPYATVLTVLPCNSNDKYKPIRMTGTKVPTVIPVKLPFQSIAPKK